MHISFDEFIDSKKWSSLKHYYSSFSNKLEQNIDPDTIKKRNKTIREWLESNREIKKVDSIVKTELKKELMNGNVVGIDGTCSTYDLTSVGFQAVIGIVAVNYRNKKNIDTIYISEPFIPYDQTSFEEIFSFAKKKKTGGEGLSTQHISSIMLYKERDFILNRSEKFKMVQGDIFPYELRYGQGRLRGLQTCLKLGRQLLSSENIVAVQASTMDPRFRLIGPALQSGEYVVLHDYYEDLNNFLNGEGSTSSAHFNPDDKREFSLFINDVKNKFCVGMYKSGKSKRGYVFYAPKKNLDEMINLLMADSEYQPIRGFPLLLDYADSICSKLISSKDFRRQVENKLALHDLLEVELSERELRRK